MPAASGRAKLGVGGSGAPQTDGAGARVAGRSPSQTPGTQTALKKFKLTPPDPNEDQLQASVADFLAFALHDQPVVWTHFPAGGYHLTPAARGRLFRLGLKAGFPDLLIQWRPARSLWIEMKTRSGTLSNAQKEMRGKLTEIGIPVVVARSVDDVIDALVLYEVPMNRINFGGRHYGDGKTTRSGAAQPPQGAGA